MLTVACCCTNSIPFRPMLHTKIFHLFLQAAGCKRRAVQAPHTFPHQPRQTARKNFKKKQNRRERKYGKKKKPPPLCLWTPTLMEKWKVAPRNTKMSSRLFQFRAFAHEADRFSPKRLVSCSMCVTYRCTVDSNVHQSGRGEGGGRPVAKYIAGPAAYNTTLSTGQKKMILIVGKCKPDRYGKRDLLSTCT